MLTESEAKERWCPLVRFRSSESGSGPAFNRERAQQGLTRPPPAPGDVPDFNCIGSKCMMWRWVGVENPDPESEFPMVAGGYCGLAGKE